MTMPDFKLLVHKPKGFGAGTPPVGGYLGQLGQDGVEIVFCLDVRDEHGAKLRVRGVDDPVQLDQNHHGIGVPYDVHGAKRPGKIRVKRQVVIQYPMTTLKKGRERVNVTGGNEIRRFPQPV